MHTSFFHSSIKLSGLLLLVISLIFPACSSDSEGSGLPGTVDKASAPDNPTKEFRFYKEDADKWSFKVTPTSDPTCPLLVTSSTMTRVDNPYFDYTKKGDNAAEVYCYFTTITWNNYGSWQQYELTLTFLSPNHGTFEGVYKSSPMAIGEPYKGVFVYDTDLEPEDFFEDDDNDSDIDWSCLTDFTWKSTGNSYIGISYIFNTDKTFSSTLSNGQSYEGKYNIDEKNNIINLTYSWETTPTAFRVLFLNEKELIMVNADLDDEFAETFMSDDSPSGSENDISISDPIISDITKSSAKIKGTVLTNNDVILTEWGVCYSLIPNSTDYIKLKANSKIIDCTISNLYEGTKYYVRLYAIYNKTTYFGKEVCFQTDGTSTDKIIMTEINEVANNATKKSTITLKVKLPNNIKSYGICYATKPNPKITDNYIEEKNSTTWELNDLKYGQTYYVRAYHIENTKVIYYDSSETTIYPNGTNYNVSYTIQSNGNYFSKDYELIVDYSLPQNTYKITTCVSRYKDAYYTMDGSNYDTQSAYIDGGVGKLTNKGHIDIECGSSSYGFCNFNYFFENIKIEPLDGSKSIKIIK